MDNTREKLADTICRDRAVDNWQVLPSDYDLADAIIVSLPDMVCELVWEGFVSGPYEISVKDGGMANLICHAVHDEDWNPEYIMGGYLSLVSMDELKEAANNHHRARVMSAFGIVS